MKDDVTPVDKKDEQTKTPSQDIASPNQVLFDTFFKLL